MPSDRRLHPFSILFGLGSQLRQFVIPGILVLVTARSAGGDWQAWSMLFLIPYSLAVIARYASFRYRYEDHELVIRTGLIFRNERHIPYARVQNINAVQNVLHRLLNVIEVHIETGGGQEAEAKMKVLPVDALDEMRRRVFADRQPGGIAAETESVPALPAGRVLLHLSPRELALSGFIDSRGLVVIAAAFGLLWEVGLLDRTVDRFFGEQDSGRGLVREVVRAIYAGGQLPLDRLALMFGAFIALLGLIRLLSMAWAAIRLHGFTITRTGDDLKTEFGLLTRVVTTIPLRRIQTLTVREGPLHRLFGRAAVRVDTAGGDHNERGATQREWLAPIIPRARLTPFLTEVLPELDLSAVEWHGVAPRAVRRAFVEWMVVAGFIAVPFAFFPSWWDLAVAALLIGWAALAAKKTIGHTRWATTPDAVLYRSGWIRRQLSVARFAKIQVVTMHESPFDRRTRMRSVKVDTAGAADASHRVDIPYLPREIAIDLYHALASNAGGTTFKW
ncbi:MAG TPA: PH domain-containing protein [Vicinamibacterales bacterium]|nr:PH domain-containing protein [Vicinamibacterales bacterium]